MKTTVQKIINELEYIHKRVNVVAFSDIIDCISLFLIKEKKDMIDFHIEVMKQGLIDEGEVVWKDKYEPKIREVAEKYFDNHYSIRPDTKFEKGGVPLIRRTNVDIIDESKYWGTFNEASENKPENTSKAENIANKGSWVDEISEIQPTLKGVVDNIRKRNLNK